MIYPVTGVFQTLSGLIWLFQTKIQMGEFRIYFFQKNLGIFRFVTLPLEIPECSSVHPRKFCKTVWHQLEIPRSKTKTHANSTQVPHEHPWKFHFLFNWPLEFPHSFSLKPLEIPWPQHSLFGFFLDYLLAE